MSKEAEQDEQKGIIADLELAKALLSGFRKVDETGLPYVEYYAPGSPEETEARKALARLLLDQKPLDRRLRRLLADLFDENQIAGLLWGRRRARIEIQLIGKKNSESAKRYFLARHVWRETRTAGSIEEAADRIGQKYKVHEKTVWNAWVQFRHLIDLEEREDPEWLDPEYD